MYINNYDNAMQTIQALKKNNKRFVKFLEACEKNPLCRQHTIEDFLIIGTAFHTFFAKHSLF